MDVNADELAGVVDLFGALTPAELEQAITELAFKRGEETPALPIEEAVAEYRLVVLEPESVNGRDDGTEIDSENDPGDREETGGEGHPGVADGDTRSGERLLIPGPTAFPTLPSGAEDLPHILAIDARTVDRGRLAKTVEERFRADAARAVATGDDERIERLLDVSYDLEAWGSFEFGETRERLDAALTAIE